MAQKVVDLLKIENVSKVYDGRTVLNNVSATLSTGKILGLIGKSAAGKSVLIHMIRGSDDYKPDSGKILYHVNRCEKCGNLDLPYEGEKCTRCGSPTKTEWVDYWSLNVRDPVRQELKLRISIMLQRTFALFGDNTVMENIFEALGNVTEKEKIDKTIELLNFVNMTTGPCTSQGTFREERSRGWSWQGSWQRTH